MSLTRMRVVCAAIATAGVLGLTPGIALAAPTQSSTEHSSFPAAGSTFTCSGPQGDITAVSGTVNQVFHMNTDAQGISHITGTTVPNGVTLMDEDGGMWTASGASWFGGKALGEDAEIVFTETDHFVLRSATGDTLKVQLVTHYMADGKSFTFDTGACTSPQG